MIVHTPWNYDSKNSRNFEYPKGESLTVPDMTLPLSELLARYTRGSEVPMFQPIYEGDTDVPDISRMDTVEKTAYAKHIAQQIDHTRKKLSDKKAEKALEDAKPIPVAAPSAADFDPPKPE